MSGEDADWQRLDKWLWHARFARHRADCARQIEAGAVRINRQPTDKAHAKLRVGDVLTLAFGSGVRVVVVRALAARRGPAEEARTLYEEIRDGGAAGGCGSVGSSAYPASARSADRSVARSV